MQRVNLQIIVREVNRMKMTVKTVLSDDIDQSTMPLKKDFLKEKF